MIKYKKKKGVFFSVDAIIAASILLLVVVLVISTYKNDRPTLVVNHLSQDMLMSLAEIKLYELNNSYVNQLSDGGYIVSLNDSVIEEVGELWAGRNFEQARNLSMEFVKYIPKNFGYSISIEDDIIVENNSIPLRTLSSSMKIISGIQKNRTSTGYVAKAYTSKAKKNNTLIIKGDIISSSVRKNPSGNNQNEVNVTFDFTIPNSSTLLGSYWFIEAAWTDTKFKAYLNGQFIPGSDASGEKLLLDFNSYLVIGNNTATVLYRFGSSGDEGGDDGATHLVINYTTTELNTLFKNERNSFYKVNSNTSIRYKKPIFIAGKINSMTVNLSVIAPTVGLSYIYNGENYSVSLKNVVGNKAQWTNTEIVDALNKHNHTYTNLSNTYFWFQADLDEYHSRENLGPQRAVLEDSFIDVQYDSNLNIYGHIDMTSVINIDNFNTSLQGDFYRNLEWRFNISNSTIPVNLDSQLAWLYFVSEDPAQSITSNSKILYSHPFSPLIKELARFGYVKDNMINGTNSYALSFSYGYAINPHNSLVSKTVLIPISVGYGDTFQNLTNATSDASNRLMALLGDMVSATEINTDVITLSNVPSMWGPVTVEMRVWQ